MDLQQILDTQKKHEKSLIQKKNVISVGTGYKFKDGKQTDEICIVVGVAKKLPIAGLSVADAIPAAVDGVVIDVVETGIVQTHQSVDPTKKHRPAMPGISIAEKTVTAGTFGAVVQRGNTKLILSNNHVLAASNSAQIGSPIYQPGCYSDDTFVLTRRGFVLFDKLVQKDKLLTLNIKNEHLEWKQPSKIHKYYHNGDMIAIKGQMYDLLVTTNHNMLIRTKSKKEPWNFVTAEEIFSGTAKSKIKDRNTVADLVSAGYGRNEIAEACGKSLKWAQKEIKQYESPTARYGGLKHTNIQIPKKGVWLRPKKTTIELFDKKICLNDWLKFLGFWIAEGSIYYNRGYRVFLRNGDLSILNDMKKILKTWGIKSNICEPGGCGQLEFHNKKIFMWLKGNCYSKRYETIEGRKSKYKQIPKRFKNINKDQLFHLLNWLFEGDGNFENGKFRKYTTTSMVLAHDVAEIGIKCGFATSISFVELKNPRHSDVYKVGISHRNLTPTLTKKPTKQKYSGFVYCVTIPNHNMFIMRNGKISVCGNSIDGGTSADKIGTLFDFVPIDFGGATDPTPPSCPFAKGAAGAANVMAFALRRKHRLMAFNIDPLAVTNKVDAALCLPDEGIDIVEEIVQIGKPTGIDVGVLGMNVQKFGRTTSYTTGSFTQINVTVQVSYGPGQTATFIGQLMAGAMSAGGDSGSACLDMSNNLVGLLYAGSDTTTIFNPIQDVFEQLNVMLPGAGSGNPPIV